MMMYANLLKALLLPKKKSHYLAKVLKQQSADDPAILAACCAQANIESLGYNYLGKYPIVLDPRGGSTTKSVLKTGQYSYHLFDALGKIYHDKAARFVNIGANIGTSSLNAYEFGFRDILAFEPVQRTFEFLKKNVQQIGAEVRNLGVGQENCTMHINLNAGSSGKSSFINKFEGNLEEVQVVRLDDVLDDRPAFLWIDTEGYEAHVLAGAEKCLSKSVDGLCVEISPEALGTSGILKLDRILKNHFSQFYSSDGTLIHSFDLTKLAAQGKQFDLFALK